MILRGRRLVSPPAHLTRHVAVLQDMQAASPPGTQFVMSVLAPVLRPHPSCVADQKCISTLVICFSSLAKQLNTLCKVEQRQKVTEVTPDPPNPATDPHQASHQNQKFQPRDPLGSKNPGFFFSVNQWRDQCGESCASLVKQLSLVFGCWQE